MSETAQPQSSDPSATAKASDTQQSAKSDSRLASPNERGRTTIADGVVEKIAGMAARDVVGVHAMGGGFARTFGAMADRVPGGGKNVTRGVKAEVGEVQTALDLEIVVDYGVSITEVARSVRKNVIAATERMTSLEVVEVNVAVTDVQLPDEEDGDEDADGKPRLQ